MHGRVITAAELRRRPVSIVDRGRSPIRPRARLLRTIGAELISSEVVAVIELVRNCYDADAHDVEIRFKKPHIPGESTLEIYDDGHGMTREVLLGPWLEPATDHKTGSGTRSPGGRRRLGSKGVGRFAAQRLGELLCVNTRAPGAETELSADFDWTQLDSGNRYLDEVSIPWWEGSPKSIEEHGTALFVSGLRDLWTQDRFDRLKLGLQRLTSPTMDPRDRFRIHLVVDGYREEITPALTDTPAMYAVEGRVEDGQASIRYTDLSGTDESWQRTLYWPSDGEVCGPFDFRIQAWDLDREPLKFFLKKTGNPYGLRDFRRLIRDHSGVSLYRDGFRILPYGEPDNDWLRLDRRRVNNPTLRLSNNQIFGWLQLGADSNPGLKDQTNREGLVSNEPYLHLQRAVLELMAYFEARRFTARRSMDITWSSRTRSLPSAGSRSDEFELALQGVGSQTSDKAVKELRKVFSEREKASTDVLADYASLATVGQMAGMVYSQLAHPIGGIEAEARQLEADLRLDLEPEAAEDALDSLKRVRDLCARMRKQMESMDPLATSRGGKKMVPVELQGLASQVVDAFRDSLERGGVQVRVEGAEVTTVTVPVRVQQALANLLQNAATAVEGRNGGRSVVIRVEDWGYAVQNNGPSISEADSELLFEPHFTTREDAAGMGLTLAAELLSSIGWSVLLARRESPVVFELRCP